MKLTFRPSAISEVEALAGLHVLCWQQAYAGLIDAATLAGLSVDDRAVLWRRMIADPDVFQLVTYADAEPVGFISSGPARGETVRQADGEIFALYVRQDHQGRGIGRKLFSAACQDWRDRGGSRLAAWVLKDNQRGRAFYERLGGLVRGSGAFTLDFQGYDEVVYAFDL